MPINLSDFTSDAGLSANVVPITAIPTITSTHVQGAIEELQLYKQSNIQFKDEGVSLGVNGGINIIDFIGGGVTVNRNGNTLNVTLNIPAALSPRGNWDSFANTPTLNSSSGSVGDWYQVSVSGTTTLDDSSFWTTGDSLFFGTNNKWNKISASLVTSIFGRNGNVVATDNDYTASQIALSTFISTMGVITNTDTVLTAIQKLDGNINSFNLKTNEFVATDNQTIFSLSYIPKGTIICFINGVRSPSTSFINTGFNITYIPNNNNNYVLKNNDRITFDYL